MGTKTPQKPKPDLIKKPLNKEEDLKDIKQQARLRLKAAKESIFTEAMARLTLEKRLVVGVGNEKEFYEELLNGFEKTLSASGIPMTQELKDKIKDNDGRIMPKENLPILRALYQQYGVVPDQ